MPEFVELTPEEVRTLGLPPTRRQSSNVAALNGLIREALRLPTALRPDEKTRRLKDWQEAFDEDAWVKLVERIQRLVVTKVGAQAVRDADWSRFNYKNTELTKRRPTPGGRKTAAGVPELAFAPPPLPEQCLGREETITAIFAGLLATRAVNVRGVGGIGKTTVVQAALRDPCFTKRFEKRIAWVSVETATDTLLLLQRVCEALGIGVAPELRESELLRFLERAAVPVLLVLDNFESPFEGDEQGVVELLQRLSALDNVSLIITIRAGSKDRPGGVRWTDCPVPVLDHGVAVELFEEVAGRSFSETAVRDRLLKEAADYLPLAIRLLARQARHYVDNGQTLATVWNRWTDLLKVGGGRGRLDSMADSVAFSLASPWMTDEARRLLSLLSLLPAGLESRWLFDPPNGEDSPVPSELGALAAEVLLDLALVQRTDTQPTRLRLLAPVRETVRRMLPPQEQDRAQLLQWYITFTTREAKRFFDAQDDGARVAVARLTPELENSVATMLEALASTNNLTLPLQVGGAIHHFSHFMRLTGSFHIALIEETLHWAVAHTQVGTEADCLFSLGQIELGSDPVSARSHFEKAAVLYKSVNSVQGQANCLFSLGQIELGSDPVSARSHFENAAALYESVNAVLGQANSLSGLGRIELRFDPASARSRFEKAAVLYKSVNSVQGQATCLFNLGQIELGSDPVSARSHFENAAALYKSMNDVQGQANCLFSLGEIELGSDPVSARSRFENAAALYKSMNDVLGQANSLSGLGRIELGSDPVSARSRFEKAAVLYKSVNSVQGQANCLFFLGEIELGSDPVSARSRFESAALLYKSMNDVLGQANCIRNLGEIEMRSDPASAREKFLRALRMYEGIQGYYSMGIAHYCLLQVAESEEQKQHHVEQVRLLLKDFLSEEQIEGDLQNVL